MNSRFQNVLGDLSGGLAVSLVALPLALGLASASGVPPMAGLITAVIAGLIVSVFGGSYVTIAGPGNGLVVVVLSAVVLLGRGDVYQGYLLTCAATVVSGVLLILFGFLRLGSLGDFFPSSAIQGMLAAIGLIIISKQIHVMFGVLDPEGGGSLELLFEIPNSIYKMMYSGDIPWEGYLGVFSLLIMIFHGKEASKFFKLFPAPVWVMLMSVGFWAYFEYVLKQPFPITADFLIPMPENVQDSLVQPDFSMIYHVDFWFVVIAITLVSSIESLLSIKAVDKLDLQKRRSNINKDLKALGLGSVASGMLGGLPVVMVIARSSVNVANGAKTRMSNFFHGIFILLFVLLLKDILHNISVSALAGILVYTGYKLAAPEVFKKVYKVGREQLLIFIATLLGTLAFGLIQGIAIGIVVTIFVQLAQIKPARNMLRYVFKPNTLLYQEGENKYYLGVKGYAGFLNYLRLKAQLDVIPRNSSIVLDMSLTKFVDHSVMEHIHYYSDEVKRRGGTLEVVGLDVHDTSSEHPFAVRNSFGLPGLLKQKSRLTKRQEELMELATEMGWDFSPKVEREPKDLDGYSFCSRRNISQAYNVLTGKSEFGQLVLRDVEYASGEFIAREVFKSSIMVAKPSFKIPDFVLSKEDSVLRFIGLSEHNDINFDAHPDFSKRFKLKSFHEKEARILFKKELIQFFENNPYYHVESKGDALLIFEKERIASISEVKTMIDFTKRLLVVIAASVIQEK